MPINESDNQAQIKSRQRVSEHGEVYTNPREVNAMLDLVKEEAERIDSRFLEPACGNGNFLTEILTRKLRGVASRYQSVRTQYDLYALVAVSSIYGIDILQDNVEECRRRLMTLFLDTYRTIHHCEPDDDYQRSVSYVLEKNILWGDALTLETPDDSHTPIVFPEWSMVGGKIKRRDYTLDALLKNQPMTEPNLFSDLGDQAFIPTPMREYPLTEYTKIHTQDAADKL